MPPWLQYPAFAELPEGLRQLGCESWLERLTAENPAIEKNIRHGDWPRWEAILQKLPVISNSQVSLSSSAIEVKGHAATGDIEQIQDLLKQLHPWRKGPYRIHGVHIDTEWRSDLKWDRLKDHITPLIGRKVLDVGCGSGYHTFRMLGDGAAIVIGIDPMLLNVVQFMAIKHFLDHLKVYVLPLAMEDIPDQQFNFDTVFSMGVLYHRRSPLDHLQELKRCLRPGGQLVLETLVIEGEEGRVLVPEDRYARMRNVWFIPTPSTLQGWIKRMGFKNPRLIHMGSTTPEEQRSTDWMTFQSLTDFLDPHNPALTIEGYPAPKRALFLAESP